MTELPILAGFLVAYALLLWAYFRARRLADQTFEKLERLCTTVRICRKT
ncbi:MAG: hypothetical protein KBH81_08705 [Phycisphaerae bacterium]|jgi:hypothetical protein|nr:hypothetical protein [Phycisphaerae bacterium]